MFTQISGINAAGMEPCGGSVGSKDGVRTSVIGPASCLASQQDGLGLQ